MQLECDEGGLRKAGAMVGSACKGDALEVPIDRPVAIGNCFNAR